MMWLLKTLSVEDIERGIEHYTFKYKTKPEKIMVNPLDWNGDAPKIDNVIVSCESTVLSHHAYIGKGTEDDNDE